MMGSNEEMSSPAVDSQQQQPTTAAGINFCPNPSEPLRQTRGTCSQRKQQQWTARSVVGIYTDEEDEEENDDVEEDEDDDYGADDLDGSTEGPQTDAEQYKETADTTENIAPVIDCEQLKNFLTVPTNKCQQQTNAEANNQSTTTAAAAQNGGGTELTVVRKQKHAQQQQPNQPKRKQSGAESRANSAENGTRKNLSADHTHHNHHHNHHHHHHRHHKSAGAQNRMGPSGKWSTVRPKRTYGTNGNSLGATDFANGNGGFANCNGHLTTPKNEQQIANANAKDECEMAQQKLQDETDQQKVAPQQGSQNDADKDGNDKSEVGAYQKQNAKNGGGGNAKVAVTGERSACDRIRRLSV